MIRNPFVVSGQIPNEYFCDRKHETAELMRLITNNVNVVLVSPRRLGKTGLIRHCYAQDGIKDNFYTFFVDILQTSSLQEFIYLLSKEIFNTLVPKGRRMVMKFVQTLKSFAGKFGFDSMSGYPTFNLQLGDIVHPELTLEEIFTYLSLADKPCIVAIDEFQQITDYPENNIEAVLRSYIQKSQNCTFIFSGSKRHIIQEMFMASARPFYNSAAFIELDVIDRQEYIDFICRMFDETGKRISPTEAGAVYDKVEGYTFYVQRICNEAFSYTAADSDCDRETIDRCIDNILAAYSSIYRQTLSEMSVRQKEVLYAVAHEGRAQSVTSTPFIRRHSLASASSVQSSLHALLKRDIVTKDGDTYRVSDFFFMLWLRKMLAGEIL